MEIKVNKFQNKFFLGRFFSLIIPVTFVLMFTDTLFEQIMILVSGIVYSALHYLFLKEDSDTVFHIRIIVFWMLLIIPICLICKQNASIVVLLPCSYALYFILKRLNEINFYLDLFFNQIKDVNELKLGGFLRERYEYVEFLNLNIKKNKTILSVISSINVFNIIYCYIIDKINLFIIVMSFLYFISLIGIIIYYNLILNETYYAFLGFKNVYGYKKPVIKSSVKIVLVAVFLAFVFSSNNSIVTLRFKTKTGTNSIFEQQLSSADDNIKSSDIDYSILEGISKKPTFKGVGIILQIIMYFTLAIVVIYILVKYLFTTKFAEFFRKNMIGKIILRIFHSIAEFFYSIFHIKKILDEGSVSSAEFKSQIDIFIKESKKSEKKKKELDNLTQKFMELIDWGEQKEIHYKNTFAPLEYTKLLNEFFITKEELKLFSEKIMECGYIFEKSLYSDIVLTTEEKKQYNEIIKNVIKC